MIEFAKQKMNVLRHDHVADKHKTVTPAHLFHNFEKQIAILRRTQPGSSLITTCGNKMKASGAVVTMQVGRHRERLSQSVAYCL